MLIELLMRLDEIKHRGRKAAKRLVPEWQNPWLGKGVEFTQAWREGHEIGTVERIAKIPLTLAYAAGIDASKAGMPFDSNPYCKDNRLEEYEKWNEGWVRALHRSDAHKLRLYDAQRGICYLCGSMILGTRTATFDHVTPKALGGDDVDNLLLAHEGCNVKKRSRPPYACELIYLEHINTVIS
jgi:hypothetical protein